jgi:hypothetical protein
MKTFNEIIPGDMVYVVREDVISVEVLEITTRKSNHTIHSRYDKFHVSNDNLDQTIVQEDGNTYCSDIKALPEAVNKHCTIRINNQLEKMAILVTQATLMMRNAQ